MPIRDFYHCQHSINELFRSIDIDRNSYLQIYQLKGFSHTLESISEISNKEKKILDNALSIGEGNGSILFVEKENKEYSLYVFYLDGAYIEALQITLDDIIDMIRN